MVTDNTSQADDTTAFLRAARSGNLEKVIEYLDTDLDINTANSNGLNALHLASKDGHVEIVTELLKRGAKVDSATKKGNTALHIASLAGQAEIVNILIQYGAAVNIQSQNGFTPLYMAAQENHDQVVKILLSNGANQSLATEDGFTPLAVAMQQGHDKVVSVLLENDSKGKVKLPALHIAAKKDDCKAADLLLQNDHKPDVTSKSGFTPLHIAAHYGNEEIARLLIMRGADVNYPAKHNITPLHVAAKWGKNNMVKILLENSAMIDAKTRDALTPLHCAARSGHEQVVATLLEHSAPISARTKNGLAPLHMASQGDHVEAARVLLYHRAPVDEVTVDYLTSLHVAAHCGHVRVAKLLLDRKADPNARALNGFTPLHIACKKNRIKVVELLLKHGASIESTTESGLTPLHVASFMGCMNIVIFLLQHEANPDVPTIRGETALHLAARANQTDIIRILLRNGAKVDARAREEQTPLHIASRLGNIDIVMLLLQHGAAVDTTTKDMYTALHIAAKEGQEEVAAILVENNASIKATTKKGYTPLHIAAKYGNMNVAKILLQKDSELDARGKNDITPLQLACRYDHPNVANLLLDKGASPHLASQNGHTPLHIAARKNQMDIASTLLENGAKPNSKSKSGFTPLHLSAQMGHYDMTNLLIEHGADPNQKAKNGCTALHLCAQENFTRVASVLVKNGADLENRTETGYRPLHVAAHFGNLPMVRFLLKHNAEVDVRTNKNYTPLHQAAQQGHANIVTALLEGNASHKARTNDGLTALNIAQKLGYISVMEVLKGLSYDTLAPDNRNWDEKYKVIAPESLQETSFMSDSDEEGESDALVSEQPYHLTADLMKNLRDDSLPIDVTRDDPLHKQVPKEEKQEFIQSNNYCLAENLDGTDGMNLGFLVSFLVDARGGTMKGCRHSGVRIIIPPRRATMPIRVTCRLVKPSKLPNPPPLMEGEALATRIIEMGPVGATFLGPVLIDIPHFAAIGDKEREIIILRSENGETWKDHDNSADNDDTLLNTPYDSQMSASHPDRITRIVTSEFPQYFAIITRIKQEVHVIGAEGGILISSVASHVQAVFPPGALTKKIKVGLQAHVIPAELTAKLLGNCVAVSPVITIEPRRRKFHKPITLTIPVPQAANKGMINQYGGETPTLRLLCSIAAGTNEAQWEDVTGSTPLTFMNDRVSFTTTVSARFWLMDCRNISEVPKMATELYKESLFVPYITNFVIYSKRMDVLEATLRILCMTDGKEGIHTLEKQEEFMEIVKSRDVEALDGKDLYIEFSGNLVPVTKSGVQLKFTFKAFRQNRLSFHVKVKDPLLDPVARMLFMREPKVAKGEPPQQPICVLNIVLPEIQSRSEMQKKLEGYEDSNIIDQKMDSYEAKYKLDGKEKCDEPKCTSPTGQKFITDTLQKEQTDAATIHESFAQKAACPLESVDASYPHKVGEEVGEMLGESEQLSPGFERQTYSEKRRFWEDISRKRDSYQRSESEVSRTSQLTINESDSEYMQNVGGPSEEDRTEPMSELRSETMEDMNIPDISECSVAEKAHYFEEQIQREMQNVVPAKLQQQDSVKSDKDKPVKPPRIRDEQRILESLAKDSVMAAEEKTDIEEKHVKESRQVEKDVLVKDDAVVEKVQTTFLREEISEELTRVDLSSEEKDKTKHVRKTREEPKEKVHDESEETAPEEPKEKARAPREADEVLKETPAELTKESQALPTESIDTKHIKEVFVREIHVSKQKDELPGKTQEELVKSTKEIYKETVDSESVKEVMEEVAKAKESMSKVAMKPVPAVVEEMFVKKDIVEETIESIPMKEEVTIEKPTGVDTIKTEYKTEVHEEPIRKEQTEVTDAKEIRKETLAKAEPITKETIIEEKKLVDDRIMQVKTTKIIEEYIEGTKDKPESTRKVVQEIVTEYQLPLDDKDRFKESAVEKEIVKEETRVTRKVEEVVVEEAKDKTTEQRFEILKQMPEKDLKKEVEGFLETEKAMHEGITEIVPKVEKKEEVGTEPVAVCEKTSEIVKEEEVKDGVVVTEKAEVKHVKKDFESRIPISAAKAEKDKSQRDAKGKISPETKAEHKDVLSPEKPEVTSPSEKKKEFESKIPKRIVDASAMKITEKEANKDSQIKKETETITVTEKKSKEEVTQKIEEHSTTKKSETQTFTKTFTDPQEAFKAFEDITSIKDKDFTTVTSKVDHKASKTVEKREILSSEISTGPEKIILHEEKERLERKKSSESKVTTETPSETVEEKQSKTEELDQTALQKMTMNLTEGKEVIDATASQSRVQSKDEQTFKSFEDKDGITTQESGVNRVRESDVDVAIKIQKDTSTAEEDKITQEKGEKSTIYDADLGKVETILQEEKHKETTTVYDAKQFVPSGKAEEEPSTMEMKATVEKSEIKESLEEVQRKKVDEIRARCIAEDLVQSIESEIEKRSKDLQRTKPLGKEYLTETVEAYDTDHEKLADDLTRKFESIMKKSMDDEPTKPGAVIQEDVIEKSSTRDSISLSEDITKDEESSPHDGSSLQARLPDRDITMSPSSISEQIELEETIDFEDTSKSDKRSERLSDAEELLQKDVSLRKEKIVSELSGAKVLEILEPGAGDRSREDSVDAPSIEMDEQKSFEPRGSLHESAAVDSLEKILHERDITVSPSTVSEDYSLTQDSAAPQRQDILVKRADSFEISSPPMVSPRLKARGLEIEPVNWMIGDEKIEISETLQPSQAFVKELEEYESAMRQQSRMSSRQPSTDLEQESAATTKSSEDMSTVESVKEITTQVAAGETCTITVTKTSKFTVLPVTEHDFDSELIENKLDISCQELVDTLQREYDAKTPTEDYAIRIREGFESTKRTESEEVETPEVMRKNLVEPDQDIPDETVIDKKADTASVIEAESKVVPAPVDDRETKEGEIMPSEEAVEKVEISQTKKAEKQSETEEQTDTGEKATEPHKPASMDDVLKEWTEAYLTKIKSSDDQKRHAEKSVDKHDKPGRSMGATAPDTCALKIKKDDYSNVDLSARYAITVLDQVVKKEIAEVKESLEAAKQDLIEELSEHSKTVFQIKDSPSEFQFKLQPESIPNYLPFLYRPPSMEQESVDQDHGSTAESERPKEHAEEQIMQEMREQKTDEPADKQPTERPEKAETVDSAAKEVLVEAAKEKAEEALQEDVSHFKEQEQIVSSEGLVKSVEEEKVLREEKSPVHAMDEKREEEEEKDSDLVRKQFEEHVERDEEEQDFVDKQLSELEQKDDLSRTESEEKRNSLPDESTMSTEKSDQEFFTDTSMDRDDEVPELEGPIPIIQEDVKDFEDERPSSVPASRSGSDVENKDESSSLAPPKPAPRRRQKPGRTTKRGTVESDVDLGSSSGDSSNYQSCDYDIGSGSRPSSSDVEALQSAAGIPSGTGSEYETALMSVDQSGGSKQTSQEYQTAPSTLSSRESMKSLNSLSSGHLGSIDSTSEHLSETLVPSETEMDRDFIEEDLDQALDDEAIEKSDSSGSDIPIDEPLDKIDSNIPCRMKRSSEMIFQQIIDDDAVLEEQTQEEEKEKEPVPEDKAVSDMKDIDSSTSAFDLPSTGKVESIDIMTSRVSEDGIQSVCTQVISKQAIAEVEQKSDIPDTAVTEELQVTVEMPVMEKSAEQPDSEDLEPRPKSVESGTVGADENLDAGPALSMTPQASMSLSSASGISVDTVVEKDRHSPDSDSFELVDKPDIIDDFVVIEEVGREAEEFDSEGKSIRISSVPQVSTKNYDRDLENLITETKQAEDAQVSTSQSKSQSKNNELFDFESEESPPQASNDDQYSQSYSDDEQYEGGKKWIEMQFHADARVYDIEYDRGPLEDIKEEEITDFEAGSSRFGSLGSQKESIGSVGSMRGSFGSTPEYDILAGKKYFTKPTDHDNISLSSLQEFEHLESAVAAENVKRLQCGSQDSSNNGSLPRRYMASRSGHGDDVSLSSLKDFEGLEKACREAHLIELRAREEEDLLEHESPENKYKLEALSRAKAEASISAAGSINPSTSGSDDYEKRIKEIDEIIRIAQSNFEKFERQDDTTEDVSQLEMERATSQAVSSVLPEETEEVPPTKDTNVMETSTDSLELEGNGDKKHPLCRSSDSLEMKTTLDIPSLSSDSLNNVKDAKESQLDSTDQFNSARRISSDSLDIPLLEQQDPESQEKAAESNGNVSERDSSEHLVGQQSSDTSIAKSGKTKSSPNGDT